MTSPVSVAQWLEHDEHASSSPPPLLSSDHDLELLFAGLSEEMAAQRRSRLLTVVDLSCINRFWQSVAEDWLLESTDESDDRVVDLVATSLQLEVFDLSRFLRAVLPFFERPRCEGVLTRWGTKDLEAFLNCCDQAWKDPQFRRGIITTVLTVLLATSYVPGTPAASTHMARLAIHPFLHSILRSLILDTCNILFPLELRLLVAIIPYAPQALTVRAPLFMIILGRAVCWNDRPFLDAKEMPREGRTYTPPPNTSLNWAVACSAEGTIEDLPLNLRPERVVRLFLVAVYNAWPSNIIAFVRDPPSYLQNKNIEPFYAVSWSLVWDTGLLAARARPLLRDFHLHPSLIYLTSTAELADDKRWDKIDPSEYIARSHMLAHSEKMSEGRSDLATESGPLSAPDYSMGILIGNESDDSRRLQRQNQLLRLEAQFSDRVRKQYLFHIGRLHYLSQRFNSDEAEIHSFVNRIKEQDRIIAGLTADLSQQRSEATQAQQKHLKWQEQLREKIASFRDERRASLDLLAQLRGDLSEERSIVERQKDELAVVKNERFKLQNQLTEAQPKIRHIEDYEVRMKQLTDAQRLWDDDVRAKQAAVRSADYWRGEVYKREQMLRATHNLQMQQTDPRVETRVKVEPIPRQCPLPDLQMYLDAVQAAKKREVALEKENLQLRVELERLQRGNPPAVEGDRKFIWG